MPDLDKILKENASWATPVAPLRLGARPSNFTEQMQDALNASPSDANKKDILERGAGAVGNYIREVGSELANGPAYQFRDAQRRGAIPASPDTNTNTTNMTQVAGSNEPNPTTPWNPKTGAKGLGMAFSSNPNQIPANTNSWETPVPKDATDIHATGGLISYRTQGANGEGGLNFIFQPPETIPSNQIDSTRAKAVYDRVRGVFTTTMPMVNGANGAMSGGQPMGEGIGAVPSKVIDNNYMIGAHPRTGTEWLDNLKQQYADKLAKYNPLGGPGVPGHEELADMAKTISTLEAATNQTNVTAMGHEVAREHYKNEADYQKGVLQHYSDMYGIEKGKLGVELGKLELSKEAQADLMKNPKYLDLALKMSQEQSIDPDTQQKVNTVNFNTLPKAMEAAKMFYEGKTVPPGFFGSGKNPTPADYAKFAKDSGGDKAKAREAMIKAGFSIPK